MSRTDASALEPPATPPDQRVVGRNAELTRLEALLDGARLGTSGSLLITGGAGIGKTTLLDRCRDLAADLLTLQADGVERESQLPYAGLSTLLRPVLDRLATIPYVQASALRSALALEATDEARRFAVPSAVLSLLAAVAEEGPVLVIVDDAQWMDEESLQAVAFAVRRLRAEGIVALFGARTGTGSGVELPGIDRIDLQPLARDDARVLLARSYADVAPAVTERLLDTAAGNPLAILEVPIALTAEQRSGAEPIAAPLPPGATLDAALSHAVDALPPDTQHALLVVAAAGSDGALVARALDRRGLTHAALEPAEDARLIELASGKIRFRHPLLRSVAYHSGTAARLRDVHAAIAEVCDRLDERAWHLAAAAVGPDEDVAAALEAAAVAAERRGALGPAAHAFERAGELSVGPERARRLLAACEAAGHAGHLDRVPAIASAALDTGGGDPAVEAGLRRAAARAALYLGDAAAAVESLTRLADGLADSEPQQAAELDLERIGAYMILGDPPKMLEAAARAKDLGDETTGLMADLVVGEALIVAGQGDAGDAMLTRCDPFLDRVDPLAMPIEVLGMAGQSSLWIDRFDRAERVLGRIVNDLRERSAPGTLAYPLAAHVQLDYRRGRWSSAYADADEAVSLAQDVSNGSVLAFALASQALVHAGRGDAAAQDTIDRARAMCQQLGAAAIELYVDRADGLAALGRGDADAAITALERVREESIRQGTIEPGYLQWHGDLIEAHVRAGNLDRARELLAELEADQRPWRRWATVIHARAQGLLADDQAFESYYAYALGGHQTLGMPFEQARTQLSLGSQRRRARRRGDAREPLRAALATFERIGAQPWVAITRAELQATGTTPPRTDAADRDELSPRELKIAMLVSEGLTNREVAAALFLSPKTVEHHLSQIYRKTGVPSRRHLSRAMTGLGAGASG